MGLLGILVALGLLIRLAYRGWSVLLLAPAAAILEAGLAGERLLAHWTQTFMGSAARFLMQFFPIFLLGALFGKLMEDSGSVSAIANFMAERERPGKLLRPVTFKDVQIGAANTASADFDESCPLRNLWPGDRADHRLRARTCESRDADLFHCTSLSTPHP